ncbi:putative transcription factor/ chromatin remodeling BED-type(Zn) family [Helianthus annuus]|nr:putative transcription factor/ chromatin remodeling BED-type(Zn) family [Helianthus annuus]
MENLNESNSDCELVSENEVVSKKKQKPKKDGKPPCPPTAVSDTPSVRLLKKRSSWWQHYTDSDVPDKAECIYCHKLIGCSSKGGTTPLRNHINACKDYPPNIDKKQKLLDLESKTHVSDDGSVETVTVPKLWEFNQEVIRKALVKMLIVDELPFSFVERAGFREFCKVINPHFIVPSRATATRDCYGYFIEERRRLVNIFKNMSTRVCLTTDTWTSGQNLSYMCLTAHFIDDDWNLHKRIINFCPIVGHSGVLIGRAVEKCLTEWGLKNVLTVTVDNASSNDIAIQHLQKVFNHWECGVLKGEFLHMRCAAHILNLVVKDGLTTLSLPIKKIRALVKYVRSSPAGLQKFLVCVEEEKIESKSLVCLDVETRWNSTYLMLESAIKFKKAFSNLLLKDSGCEKEIRKGVGSLIHEDDWIDVTSLLPFLKIFYEATLRFSGSRYVTSNAYVHEIFGIGTVIDNYTMHEDNSINSMALNMKQKYMKYWGNVLKLNQFLFIAVVLDPRRKWQYIEWLVKEKFVNTILTKALKSNMQSLFELYENSMPKKKKGNEVSSSTTSDTSMAWSDDQTTMDIDAIMSKRFEMSMGSSEASMRKSELEKYLGEDREPMDSQFDVLKWWKVQQCRYPVLARMARDILAIPVSTVASESAFSTGGRVLDSFRTSLTPRMVEALVCAQDWLRASNNPITIEDTIFDIEKLEEDMKELTLEQPTIVIDETVDETIEPAEPAEPAEPV